MYDNTTTYDLSFFDKDFLPNLNKFELDLFDDGYKIVKDNYYNDNDEIYSTVYKGGVIFCKITHYYSPTFEFKVSYYKNNHLIKDEWYMLDRLSSVYEYDKNMEILNSIKLLTFETKEYRGFHYQSGERYLLRDEELEMYNL